MKRTFVISTLFAFALVSFACTKKADTATPAKAEKAPSTSAEAGAPAPQKEVVEVKAPSAGNLSILEVSACQSVENRTPVGIANKFPSDIGRVYVFTKVGLDASQKAKIQHIWRYKGKEVAKVTLPIQGPQWRTYSSKRIDSSHKGAWQVDIVANETAILSSVSFQVE